MAKTWCCRICGHDESSWSSKEQYYFCMGCGVMIVSLAWFNLPTIKFKKIHPDAKLPTKGSDGAVGYDLYATESQILVGYKTVLVKTGLQVELPPNVEMQIRPRSGLAKKGVRVGNAPGTVDPDYRGEIMVMMAYAFDGYINIEKGERVAQALFTTKLPYRLEEVLEISDTDRGAGGFGSTGNK